MLTNIDTYLAKLHDAIAQVNTGLYWLGARDGGIVVALALIVTYLITRKRLD